MTPFCQRKKTDILEFVHEMNERKIHFKSGISLFVEQKHRKIHHSRLNLSLSARTFFFIFLLLFNFAVLSHTQFDENRARREKKWVLPFYYNQPKWLCCFFVSPFLSKSENLLTILSLALLREGCIWFEANDRLRCSCTSPISIALWRNALALFIVCFWPQ